MDQAWYEQVGRREEWETAMHASRQSQQTQTETGTEMKIGQMMAGKYIKKEDCEPPVLATIERFEQENVARDDQPEDMKWVMYFSDNEKGLVMNSTNLQLAAIAFGTQETDEWIGRQLVLYHDPNVSFGGKLVGGVRVRAPKKKPKPAGKPDPRPEPPDEDPPFSDVDDDIPF